MWHYVTTWFALDALTVFLPGGFDIYLGSSALSGANRAANIAADMELSGGGDGGAAGKMGMLRVLRALRLIKLVRLVRASRVFDRWKAKVTLSYGWQVVLQCLLMMLFTSHWFACVIALQASLHNSVHDTLAGEQLFGLCASQAETDAAAVEAAQNGVELVVEDIDGVLAGCSGRAPGQWYLAAFSWSGVFEHPNCKAFGILAASTDS